jgi:hypothetical protein
MARKRSLFNSKTSCRLFYRPRIYLSVSIFDNLVTHALFLPSGFNATIFAYGQTSSGKTHTMMGNAQVSFHLIFINGLETLDL